MLLCSLLITCSPENYLGPWIKSCASCCCLHVLHTFGIFWSHQAQKYIGCIALLLGVWPMLDDKIQEKDECLCSILVHWPLVGTDYLLTGLWCCWHNSLSALGFLAEWSFWMLLYQQLFHGVHQSQPVGYPLQWGKTWHHQPGQGGEILLVSHSNTIANNHL